MRWILMAALLPTPLFAEGATQSMICGLDTLCASFGRCFEHNSSAIFVIEPVSVDADGAGDYTINRGDDTFPMRNVTGTGPMIWSEAPGDREVILLTGENTILWQRFKGETNTSEIAFLTCEISR
jgi:hypothetical protein